MARAAHEGVGDSSEYLLSSGNILSKSISWKKGNEDPDDEVINV
jgi:hypothetical protein